MKPVFKCEYCKFMGTEEEVREHEPNCMFNYDRKSCYTCKHVDGFSMADNLVKYKCDKDVDVPEGKVIEFCKFYERKPKSYNPYSDLLDEVFGR